MQPQNLSGHFGVVLVPDPVTAARVRRLADASPGATFRTQKPHISLYHAEFAGLPREQARSVLERIADHLMNDTVRLEKLTVFGGKFVFWDAYISPQLRAAHEVALELAPFRVVDGKSSAAGLGLTLTDRQIRNDHEFGYVFVKDDFRPHATVAYCENGVADSAVGESEALESRVVSVGLYELGPQGRIVTAVEEVAVLRNDAATC